MGEAKRRITGELRDREAILTQREDQLTKDILAFQRFKRRVLAARYIWAFVLGVGTGIVFTAVLLLRVVA